MMSKNELDKIAHKQYRKATEIYITTFMKEVVEDGESDLQLYCRVMSWYNNKFEVEGVHTLDSGSLPPPPPPPPPNH